MASMVTIAPLIANRSSNWRIAVISLDFSIGERREMHQKIELPAQPLRRLFFLVASLSRPEFVYPLPTSPPSPNLPLRKPFPKSLGTC